MIKDPNSLCDTLEYKVHVLEEENAQLAERAEESLLLGLITEDMQALSDEVDVFENTIERISILKAIPFVTCGYLDQNELKPIASYFASSDQENVGYPITIEPKVIHELEYGPIVVEVNDNLNCVLKVPIE